MDQCFSCISRLLHRTKAFTLPALAEACRTAFTGKEGKPEIVFLEDTADVKQWLFPFADTFHNITGSHQYTLERKEVDGVAKAVMSIKQFAACSEERRVTVGCLLKVCLHRKIYVGCLINFLRRPIWNPRKLSRLAVAQRPI